MTEVVVPGGDERGVTMRVSGTLTKHKLQFDVPVPASTASDNRNPDKAQLQADILVMGTTHLNYG